MKRKRKAIYIIGSESVVMGVTSSKDGDESRKKMRKLFHNMDVSTGELDEYYMQDFTFITKIPVHILYILLAIWSPIHWIIRGYVGYEFLDDNSNQITKCINYLSGVKDATVYGKYQELEDKIAVIFDNCSGKDWNTIANEVREATSGYYVDGEYIEVSNTFFDRLLVLFVIPIYLLALLTLPINYILTGKWGYDVTDDNWIVKLTDRVFK